MRWLKETVEDLEGKIMLMNRCGVELIQLGVK